MSAGCALILMTALIAGCESDAVNAALGAVGVTAVGGQSPTDEIEVIYYFGVFDPQDQLPPTVYRVRVHGQASFISQAKFASGWVRAELIDSLSTGGKFGDQGIEIDQTNSLAAAKLQTGRRLVMFGPEGFREAPRDHRLVIVMGSDPSKFFQAMDASLGAVSQGAATAQAVKQNDELVAKLFETLVQLKDERRQLSDLSKRATAAGIPASP